MLQLTIALAGELSIVCLLINPDFLADFQGILALPINTSACLSFATRSVQDVSKRTDKVIENSRKDLF